MVKLVTYTHRLLALLAVKYQQCQSIRKHPCEENWDMNYQLNDLSSFISFYGTVAHCSFHGVICRKIDTKQVDLMFGYGTPAVLGTVLCVFIWPRSSQWFQTVVWTCVIAQWQTCRGTICHLLLRKLIASRFTWAEYELAVSGENFLEVYKSEHTGREGPWSQARQAVTRRRLELRWNPTRGGVKSLRTAGQNSS